MDMKAKTLIGISAWLSFIFVGGETYASQMKTGDSEYDRTEYRLFEKGGREEIAAEGSGHNGSRLYLKADDLSGRAVRLEFIIECRKNWSGRHFGFSYVEVINFTNTDIQYNPSGAVDCSVHGPGDGGIAKRASRPLVFIIRGASLTQFKAGSAIVVKIEGDTTTWTEEFVNNLKNMAVDLVNQLKGVKNRIKNRVIDEAPRLGLILLVF